MEYIICIIIMLVWAMIFYCWGYSNGRKDACKHIAKWMVLKGAEIKEGEHNDV